MSSSDDLEPAARETLTPQTKVQLGSAIAICAALLAGLVWFNDRATARFDGVTEKLQTIKSRLDVMDLTNKLTKSDRWTGTQMKVWALELQNKNKTLAVPSVEVDK